MKNIKSVKEKFMNKVIKHNGAKDPRTRWFCKLCEDKSVRYSAEEIELAALISMLE